MIYNSEKKLTKDFLNKTDEIKSVSEYHTIYFRQEYPVKNQIPDILYVSVHNNNRKFNLPNKWNYKHSFITSLLRIKKYLDSSEIANSMFESERTVIPIINELKNASVLEQGGNKYFLSKNFLAMNCEIIAIELKLSDWRRALEQAENYLLFANSSIVAMDLDCIPSKEDLVPFKNKGIGLCGISEKGIQWFATPLKYSKSNPEWEYIFNTVLIPKHQKSWVLI